MENEIVVAGQQRDLPRRLIQDRTSLDELHRVERCLLDRDDGIDLQELQQGLARVLDAAERRLELTAASSTACRSRSERCGPSPVSTLIASATGPWSITQFRYESNASRSG